MTDLEAALKFFRSKFRGRTYYPDGLQRHDEVLVAEVERLQRIDSAARRILFWHKQNGSIRQLTDLMVSLEAAFDGIEEPLDELQRLGQSEIGPNAAETEQ